MANACDESSSKKTTVMKKSKKRRNTKRWPLFWSSLILYILKCWMARHLKDSYRWTTAHEL